MRREEKDMESILVRHTMMMISAYPRRNPPVVETRRRGQVGFSVASSKSKLGGYVSDFQDFGNYAKPSRLLPATQMTEYYSPEKIFPSFGVDATRNLYKLKLHTSSFYGSGLTDLSSGILVCLIDENGDSILNRFPASEDTSFADDLHFQRGSVDEFTLYGAGLEKIEALWVGVESGQWRLGGVSLIVICGHQTPIEEEIQVSYNGLQYDFEVEDILLGEGSNISMTELRPRLVTELSRVDPSSILSKTSSQTMSRASQEISNKDTMREYADLKFSLLLYDSVLIFLGTSIANFTGGDKAAFAFLTGGVIGFSYLFLLQRSVDGLPASTSTSMNSGENFGRMVEGFKSPVAGLALAVGLSLVVLKYGSGDVSLAFTPKDLMVGMMGFLACKVAVVLAAFKSMPMGVEENK